MALHMRRLGFEVDLYVLSGLSEVRKILARMPMGSVSSLYFAGHGNSLLVDFGNSDARISQNSEIPELARVLDESGLLILNSCSATEGENNIARALARQLLQTQRIIGAIGPIRPIIPDAEGRLHYLDAGLQEVPFRIYRGDGPNRSPGNLPLLAYNPPPLIMGNEPGDIITLMPADWTTVRPGGPFLHRLMYYHGSFNFFALEGELERFRYFLEFAGHRPGEIISDLHEAYPDLRYRLLAMVAAWDGDRNVPEQNRLEFARFLILHTAPEQRESAIAHIGANFLDDDTPLAYAIRYQREAMVRFFLSQVSIVPIRYLQQVDDRLDSLILTIRCWQEKNDYMLPLVFQRMARLQRIAQMIVDRVQVAHVPNEFRSSPPVPELIERVRRHIAEDLSHPQAPVEVPEVQAAPVEVPEVQAAPVEVPESSFVSTPSVVPEVQGVVLQGDSLTQSLRLVLSSCLIYATHAIGSPWFGIFGHGKHHRN